MDNPQLYGAIDHTALGATVRWKEIRQLCEEAVQYGMASVCIPPSYIHKAREAFPTLKLCTVIGFPLGYNTTETKVEEAKQAIQDGANELDMVVNLGWVKDGAYDLVTREIAEIKRAAGGSCLKVIVETCYLTQEEKIAMCKAVTEAGADFIKTSTGFGTGGATLEDVKLFRHHIGPDVKIKAAGGVRSLEDLNAFMDSGAARIGTSSAIKLLSGGTANQQAPKTSY